LRAIARCAHDRALRPICFELRAGLAWSHCFVDCWLPARLNLRRPGYTGVVDLLVAALEDPHLQVRIAAAAALGALGDQAAVPGLQSALQRLQAMAAATPQAAAESMSLQAGLQQARLALSAGA